MHRGFELVRSDLTIMALNLAAVCILLKLIFQKRCSDGNSRGMTADTGGRQSFVRMLLIDSVLFTIFTVSALIHELSITLLPPVILLFFFTPEWFTGQCIAWLWLFCLLLFTL